MTAPSLSPGARVQRVTGAAHELRLSIASIPNEPPTIRIVGEPKTNIRGTVTLSYEGSDEYGIASVETRFAEPRWRGQPMANGHPLVDPPMANLPPPSNRPHLPRKCLRTNDREKR